MSNLSATEAEAAVLGAAMLDRSAPERLFRIISTPDVFTLASNRETYLAIADLYRDSHPIDLISVVDRLRKRGALETAGGAYGLSELTLAVAGSGNLEYHAQLLVEKFISRCALRSAQKLQGALLNDLDPFEAIERAVQDLRDTVAGLSAGRAITMKTAFEQAFKDMQARASGENQGLPTGFPELDDMTGGLYPGQLWVIAGRSGKGKTAVAEHIAQTIAETDRKVLFISLEMSSKDLALRSLSRETMIPAIQLRRGMLTTADWQAVMERGDALGTLPIHFVEDSMNLERLTALIMSLHTEHNYAAVVVDYLQLISSAKAKGNREQEVAAVSRGLKQLALALSIPVIAPAQLNRAVDNRPDKEPTLADLRESGAIENDADIVLFVYEDPEADTSLFRATDPIPVLMKVGKNRAAGLFGTFARNFNKSVGTFS